MEQAKLTKAILAMGGNFTDETLNNLSAETLNNLSAETLNNLSAETLNNLSARTLNNLSARTLKKIQQIWDTVPKLEMPYTSLLRDIKARKRLHNQSVFGPEDNPGENLCGTQMCTAGHLVNMAGAKGYELKNKHGWAGAAGLIHIKTHPDAPLQNFGSIQQSDAMAYIELMAEFEGRKNKKQSFAAWFKALSRTSK